MESLVHRAASDPLGPLDLKERGEREVILAPVDFPGKLGLKDLPDSRAAMETQV